MILYENMCDYVSHRGAPFDAVFMNYHMRMMGGAAAAVDIRRLGFKAKLFGLMSCPRTEEMEEYLKKGADRVIVKPMTKEHVNLTLRGTVSLPIVKQCINV
jgi:CheY-like chemotaxis protein